MQRDDKELPAIVECLPQTRKTGGGDCLARSADQSWLVVEPERDAGSIVALTETKKESSTTNGRTLCYGCGHFNCTLVGFVVAIVVLLSTMH